jgi:hypothetical protein
VHQGGTAIEARKRIEEQDEIDVGEITEESQVPLSDPAPYIPYERRVMKESGKGSIDQKNSSDDHRYDSHARSFL